MSLFSWLTSGGGRTPSELAERLGISLPELESVPLRYHSFQIPKRSGGFRIVHAPELPLKAIQRQIYRRLLKRLPTHDAVTGFRPGYSIASNAACHVGQAVVVRMDIRDFFSSTTATRIELYFRKIGWNRAAAGLLTRLCTWEGALPQGAPTSPVLANAVNFQMDKRLAGLARKRGAIYTRYADDLTFSFAEDRRDEIGQTIYLTKEIVQDCGGYKLHQKKKLRIRRAHQQQNVTGLVVNKRMALPRKTRRWLRAVDHRLQHGGKATLTPEQRQGWAALEHMVETHRSEK